MTTHVKAMLEDYQGTTTGGKDFGEAANDEQNLISVSRQITEANLTGTELVDTWVSPGGTFYALVGLDLQAFKNTVSDMQQLDEGVRKAVLERSDSAFERMDQAFDQSKVPAPSDPPFAE